MINRTILAVTFSVLVAFCGTVVAVPSAHKKMTVNNMSTSISVIYRFDKADPITLDIPGYESMVIEVPAGAHIISAQVLRSSNTFNKEYTFSVIDDKSYDASLNSNIVIFAEDNNLLHVTKAFKMITEEQIRHETERREHLKNLPRHIYDRVVGFFQGITK